MKRNLLPLFVGVVIAVTLSACKKPADSPQSGGSEAAAGNPDDPVTLKLRWAVGGRFAHRMEMAQTVQVPVIPGVPGSRPTTQEMTMGQEFSLNVLRERPGGGRDVELEFQSANMSSTRNGNEVMAFDTRGEATGDEANPAIQPFRQMIGQKLTLVLDSSNNVERVEGVEELNKKLFGDSDGSANPMAAMLNEEHFKQMMMMGRHLPAEPVKPGATWPSQFEITMGPLGKSMLDLTYTFKGWEQHEQRRCAALTFAGSLGANRGDPNNPVGAMMSVAGGQCSGKSWFDPARGMIIDTAIDQTIQMRMKIPGRPNVGPAPEAPVETTLKQTVSIKLVEEAKKQP